MVRRKLPTHRSLSGRRPRSVAWGFEPLETRQLLATITVGTGGDFPTLQQAVNNARSGDVIQVANGNYAESVDLSQMGSALGRGPGDLTIEGSNALAVIDSPGGPALFNSTPFEGDLTLQRLTLRSSNSTAAEDSGLVLDNYEGTLRLSSLLVSTTTDTGIRVSQSTGSISLRDSEVSGAGDGADDHGVLLERFQGTVVLRENTVQNVTDDGIVVQAAGGDQLLLSLGGNSIAGDPIGFTTTNLGIRLEASGNARVDMTVEDSSLDDLDEGALSLHLSNTARVQARLDDNIVFNTNSGRAVDILVEDTAQLAFSLADNTISDTRDAAFQLTLDNSAEVNAYVQNNLFFNIGDGAGDDAMRIVSASGSDATLNAYLNFNDYVTVSGVGALVTADGNSRFNITATENSHSDVNTQSGSAAVVIGTAASSAAGARVNLDFADNTVNQTAQGDFRFEQRGSGQFRVEGTAGSVTEQVEATNSGTLQSTGTLAIVAPGSFDHTRPLLLGDQMWQDDNADGVQQLDLESGMPDVLLTLTGTETNGGRNVERTTLSGAGGEYRFSGLLPGDYTVRIEPLFGYSLSLPGQGDDTTLDSDFPRDSRSADVTLANETDRLDLDAGFIRNWQNPRRPTDVNGDGIVAPVDALIVINDLNVGGSRPLPLPPVPPDEPPPYLDVNGDTRVAPIDVLQVINFLNSGASGEGESGPSGFPSRDAAEGESPSPLDAPRTAVAERPGTPPRPLPIPLPGQVELPEQTEENLIRSPRARQSNAPWQAGSAEQTGNRPERPREVVTSHRFRAPRAVDPAEELASSWEELLDLLARQAAANHTW